MRVGGHDHTATTLLPPPQRKAPLLIVQGAGLAFVLVWMGVEGLPHH